MFRRISTKLIVAVLGAVVLPFVGFALFVDFQMTQELSLKVVLQTLQGVAQGLAQNLEGMLELRQKQVERWSQQQLAQWSVKPPEPDEGRWGAEYAIALPEGRLDDLPARSNDFRRLQTRELDSTVAAFEVYDLLLLVDQTGRLAVCNGHDPLGRPLDPDLLRSLFARDYAQERWFQEGLAGRPDRVDWHVSPYMGLTPSPTSPRPSDHHIGFSSPVFDYLRPERPVGVLFALVNWQSVQSMISVPVIKDYFRGLVTPGKEPSPYAWIWASDCDTIIAHEDHTLYGAKVSGPRVQLPSMVADARSARSGLYREYTFGGKRKNAAFWHTLAPRNGGFGWVVGVGIDNDDIFARKAEMHDLLVKGTAAVLLVVVLWTMVIARRTTNPILVLEQQTRRIAEGDLETQIDVHSRDEVGQLAVSFNRMTRALREQREKLIKAEKDAAWREMARQIAHDIKNPLTPMKLSLDLLERARRERRDDLVPLLDRTIELMSRQVSNLREIATDFYEFTGGRKPEPVSFDLADLLAEVLQLHEAWANELGVAVLRHGERGPVHVDQSKLRRVVTNLVSNALQAMPEGGKLDAWVGERDGRVVLEIRDAGSGIDPEARQHLFEPYFTTRSEGTGLGLAIAKRVIEEMGGTIELEPRSDGPGTVARVTLPRHEGSAAPDGRA